MIEIFDLTAQELSRIEILLAMRSENHTEKQTATTIRIDVSGRSMTKPYPEGAPCHLTAYVKPTSTEGKTANQVLGELFDGIYIDDAKFTIEQTVTEITRLVVYRVDYTGGES